VELVEQGQENTEDLRCLHGKEHRSAARNQKVRRLMKMCAGDRTVPERRRYTQRDRWGGVGLLLLEGAEITLGVNSLENLLPVNIHFSWRGRSEFNLLSFNAKHSDMNVITNTNGFAEATGQN
jgi:hypothetical protein